MHSQFVGPSPLLAHVGRASNFILPLEQARRQNDTWGTPYMSKKWGRDPRIANGSYSIYYFKI